MECAKNKETSARKRRQKCFWEGGAEDCFVEVWGQKINDLRSAKKNIHIYHEMTAELIKQGFDLSVADIKYKIANLTAKYR